MTTVTCSYCSSTGENMAQGPGMNICSACVKRLHETDEKVGTECAFCGQTSDEVQRLHPAKSTGKSVCGYCIENYTDTM